MSCRDRCLYLNFKRLISGIVSEVRERCVYALRDAFGCCSAGFVDVSEHVQLWLHYPDPLQQILTADWLASYGHVAVSKRRTVGYQHVGVVGDQAPFGSDRLAARQVERPVEELRLPRAAVELDPVDYDLFFLQQDGIRHRGS